MRRRFPVALALAALCGIAAVHAAEHKPADAIAYRQSIFKLMRWNFSPLVAMVRGEAPFDAAEFGKRAERVAFLSHQLGEGFPPGSDQGAVTDARPDIWKNRADFDRKLADLEREADALREVAKGGDADAIKSQFGRTAGTCKACHDAYKAD